jgi:hypothetical protein
MGVCVRISLRVTECEYEHEHQEPSLHLSCLHRLYGASYHPVVMDCHQPPFRLLLQMHILTPVPNANPERKIITHVHTSKKQNTPPEPNLCRGSSRNREIIFVLDCDALRL